VRADSAQTNLANSLRDVMAALVALLSG
jgi:hypothetical protein